MNVRTLIDDHLPLFMVGFMGVTYAVLSYSEGGLGLGLTMMYVIASLYALWAYWDVKPWKDT